MVAHPILFLSFKWAKFNRFSTRALVPLLGVCLCLICNKLFYR